jgi:site-specific recombinase XerD
VDRADRKGGEPRAFWLNADRVGAWEAFMYAAAWPKDVRSYQARHSIALDLRARGLDHLADVAAVLGHRQIATTRKHNAPVLVSRLK